MASVYGYGNRVGGRKEVGVDRVELNIGRSRDWSKDVRKLAASTSVRTEGSCCLHTQTKVRAGPKCF